MKYRVFFKVNGGGLYFTEWFDTIDEAIKFTEDSNNSPVPGIFLRHIEDSEGNVV